MPHRRTHIVRAAKELHFNKNMDALKKMQAGADKLATVVGVTLGPKVGGLRTAAFSRTLLLGALFTAPVAHMLAFLQPSSRMYAQSLPLCSHIGSCIANTLPTRTALLQGRNVVLESKYGSPKIVNDGVTIAKEVELEDPVENIGAKLVRQAAARTNDTAGDGTTTATILSAAFIAEGLKIVAAGTNPVQLTRGMDKTVAALVKELAGLSTEVASDKDLANVAAVSAGACMCFTHAAACWAAGICFCVSVSSWQRSGALLTEAFLPFSP